MKTTQPKICLSRYYNLRCSSWVKSVLPKGYARPALDKKRLGELIDLLGNVGFNQKGNSSKDLLGRVYQYFLVMFARPIST